MSAHTIPGQASRTPEPRVREPGVIATPLSDREFEEFRRFIFDRAGIHLSVVKKALVAGRLARRLRELGLGSYGAYLQLLRSAVDLDEVQVAIDLLTTNETYFFREIGHFEYLRDHILPQVSRAQPFRVWSAASSSGEEAYSIAMLLADRIGASSWEVFGSDISAQVLERARAAVYPLQRTEFVPEGYMRRFCLKGVGAQDGTFLVDRPLRERVSFNHVNLNGVIPSALGAFDVIFLRNVMIYFNQETKRRLIAALMPHLRRGGHLFIGHSESLNGVTDLVRPIQPAIYVRSP